MARELTPYDTGDRLEPAPWVGSDGRVGQENRRPAQPDDYGRVDFTDDEGATVVVVYVERTPEGQHVVYVEDVGDDVKVIH